MDETKESIKNLLLERLDKAVAAQITIEPQYSPEPGQCFFTDENYECIGETITLRLKYEKRQERRNSSAYVSKRDVTFPTSDGQIKRVVCSIDPKDLPEI